jgi:hypothetical protein
MGTFEIIAVVLISPFVLWLSGLIRHAFIHVLIVIAVIVVITFLLRFITGRRV